MQPAQARQSLRVTLATLGLAAAVPSLSSSCSLSRRSTGSFRSFNLDRFDGARQCRCDEIIRGCELPTRHRRHRCGLARRTRPWRVWGGGRGERGDARGCFFTGMHVCCLVWEKREPRFFFMKCGKSPNKRFQVLARFVGARHSHRSYCRLPRGRGVGDRRRCCHGWDRRDRQRRRRDDTRG